MLADIPKLPKPGLVVVDHAETVRMGVGTMGGGLAFLVTPGCDLALQSATPPCVEWGRHHELVVDLHRATTPAGEALHLKVRLLHTAAITEVVQSHSLSQGSEPSGWRSDRSM